MSFRYLVKIGGVLVALVPAIAAAQTPAREAGWDFGVDVVYQLSDDADFEGGSTLDFDDDIGLALLFGYRFTSKFELQFAIDWNDVDYSGVLQSADIPSLTASIRGELETFTPRVNAVYNFMDAPLTPYVGGGIGWSFIDTNIPTGQVSVGCWWDPWWGQICTPYQETLSTDQFTYQLGAGVRWDFNAVGAARLSWEKTWFDYSNATSTPSWDQIKLGFMYRIEY
jgi:opacity protein-like surface antigen